MGLKTYLTFFIATLIFSCSPNSTSNNKNAELNPDDKEKNTSNSMTQKKFKESDNTAVFTTKFVIIDHKDITEVHHDEDDGAWQFFSDDQFDDMTKVAKLVGLGQITSMDPTLFEIADIPVGYVAHRKFKGDKWTIQKKQ